MNKRYIDFVPTGKTKSVTGNTAKKEQQSRVAMAFRETQHSRTGQSQVSQTQRVQAQAVGSRARQSQVPQSVNPRQEVIRRTAAASSSTVNRSVSSSGKIGFSAESGAALGVIEDLNTKFVSKEVEKRPLGGEKPQLKKSEIKEVKAKKLIGRKTKAQVVEKPVEKPVKKPTQNAYNVPKTPFINQEKVVKRPLSRNVYQKKVEEPKEEQGPVTIIAKPEKEGFAGRVIAIIIIIILGATAGTVAFLLLPR